MEIIFRKMVYRDLEDVVKLCNKVFNENTNIDYAKKVYNDTKNDHNQIYLVGLVDNKIVSHLKITIIPTIYEDMNTYAMLNHVCVDEDYRRHNIATMMMKVAEDICRKRGCVTMNLWSKNKRVAAHEFYKNYGFVVEDAKFFFKKVL